MLYLIYNVVLMLAVLVLLPLLPVLALWKPFRQGLPERLGLLPKALRQQALIHEGALWVHAASLGEVNAVAPVLRELLPQMPRQALVITCTTVAGREQARRLFPQAAACLLLPVDLPWLIRSWIQRFKPRLVLLAETELWPNFLRELKRQGAQVLVANGRLTERSFRRYRLLGRRFAEVLDCVEIFAMQAQPDADRMVALGARRARVLVVGNTKFDLAADVKAARIAAESLRRELGWRRDQPVIVAGSTRPGEEVLLAKAFADLRRRLPEACFVMAPRHLDRADDAAAALKSAGLSFVRRSLKPQKEGTVLLLDTLGELRSFYALAEPAGLAWIGGSFRDFGGQNPLEASALGVPALFGSSMRHFPEVAEALLEAGAAVQVPAPALAEASLKWLQDAKARRGASEAALACVQSRAGASKRAADLAWKLLLVTRMKREGRHRGQETYDRSQDLEPVGVVTDADETRLA
jgi:3-deoxy-D-manno-octulosonic-acid transferase